MKIEKLENGYYELHISETERVSGSLETMTEVRDIILAEQKAKTARQVGYGEFYCCPRCKGKGYGSWYVENGMCFKCAGHGIVRKEDPNAPVRVATIYKVQVGAYVYQCNTRDSFNQFVNPALWLGDRVTFQQSKNGLPLEGVIVGKMKGDKKSKNFDQISFI